MAMEGLDKKVVEKMRKALEYYESLDATTRAIGKWERHYTRPGVYANLFWYCSACGKPQSYEWANKYSFCPECGAKMGEDSDADCN